MRPHTRWTVQHGSDQPQRQLLAVMICIGAAAGLASVLAVTAIAENL